MCDIDYIFDLIDWNQPQEIQKRGLELAKSVKSINAFLQPCDKKYNKNVWDNCAKILYERGDEELRPYLGRLMEWLEDMNAPGAFVVFDRLLLFRDKQWLKYIISVYMKEAELLSENVWFENLNNLNSML